MHVRKHGGTFVPGSPLNALNIDPPFKRIHLIDIDGEKAGALREQVADQENVEIYEGHCNSILLEEIFPNCLFKQYRRGLCLLDPYGLQLKWDVLQTAGHMKSVEVFLNFPIMDMNRNVLWKNVVSVSEENKQRMDTFWGDRTWRDAAYTTDTNLFGYEEKLGNWEMAQAFRARLREVAGFAHVPDPIPMRNSKGSIVYYLFFASPKPVAADIVKDIFAKYRNRGND